MSAGLQDLSWELVRLAFTVAYLTKDYDEGGGKAQMQGRFEFVPGQKFDARFYLQAHRVLA